MWPGERINRSPAYPVRIPRVMPHHLLKEQVSSRSQRHSGPRVAGSDLLHSISSQHAQRINCTSVNVGEVSGLIDGGFGHFSVLQAVIRVHQGLWRHVLVPCLAPAYRWAQLFVFRQVSQAQRKADEPEVPMPDDQIGLFS